MDARRFEEMRAPPPPEEKRLNALEALGPVAPEVFEKRVVDRESLRRVNGERRERSSAAEDVARPDGQDGGGLRQRRKVRSEDGGPDRDGGEPQDDAGDRGEGR